MRNLSTLEWFLITWAFCATAVSSSGCGGRTLYEVAKERSEESRQSDRDRSAFQLWEQEIPDSELDAAHARMVAHHVLVHSRRDVLLVGEQISKPELIDGEPALTYPREFRSRDLELVVMACVVEINGLVSSCTTVHGPSGLAGYVRRTTSQWSYLPAIGFDGQPHAANFLFVLPFRPF